ncbi:GGDEF domain-containing protein [Cognatiyoonia sp. IB215182]|uniref:GGDEF domain-containing protein n=1 Tax=Cognatiyoonia sp. IB215182 TaxID=3097353 RepID=UPI002A164CCA|nr:GGDEF domain-containing protein [Cognatiyoonia sp. IB215182]MDX8353451.1 GGDEF domain-containing protein [Cognatiyoonia sp. IB215182]
MHLVLILGLATTLSLIAQLLSPDPVIVKLVVVIVVAVLLATIPVSIMLRLRENKRRMHQMAQVDGITGVTNQQTFLQRFTRALPQSGVLLMLDLDQFKKVNDMGDAHATQLCLMALAQRCREVTRATDIVGRLDGAVFGIYLPGAPIERGRQIADELTKGIQVVTPRGVLHATVSVGIVVADGWTPLERLMKSVEQALDLAKLRGPAQVMLRQVVAA